MNLSFVEGSREVPLKYETIGRAFDETAHRFARRDALIVPLQQVRWSYADLKQRVDQFAAGLLSLGLNPGDRIGIWAPNCAEWTVTQFASAKAGLILVNINPAYRLSELEFCLKKGWLPGAGHRRTAQEQRLPCHAAHPGARARPAALPMQLSSVALPQLRLVIRLGRTRTAGCLNFEDVAAARLRHRTAPVSSKLAQS